MLTAGANAAVGETVMLLTRSLSITIDTPTKGGGGCSSMTVWSTARRTPLCWGNPTGPEACTEMCYATESSSNNFIALRTMPGSRFGDTLYVEYQAGALSVSLCTQPVRPACAIR